MDQQTIVGLFSTRERATEVRRKLEGAGVPESSIKLSASEVAAGAAPDPQQEGGFWDWLFGSDVSSEERERYSGHLRSGNVAVSVLCRSEAERTKIAGLMEQFDPIDIEGDEAPPTTRTTGVMRPSGSSMSDGADGAVRDGEQTIALAKEELTVGKRQVERRHRIRTHVTTRPVEEAVTLRDETIVIERRPATQAAVGDNAFQARDFEVVERDEEAVVSKQAHVKEEVVIHKSAKDHVETVRDTVRETHVDIDREGAGFDRAAAGSKPSSSPTGGAGSPLGTEKSPLGGTVAEEPRELDRDGPGRLKK